MLRGTTAFYNQPDYLETTKNDFTQKKLLPASYSWQSENLVIRIVRIALSIIFFPFVFPYEFLHAWIGEKAFLPARAPANLGLEENHADISRSRITMEGEWKYKRITIKVDDFEVDAVIVGKVSTLANRRWVLFSNGNAEFYEDKLLRSRDFKQILSNLNGNAIVFNYPGVGASEGVPNKWLMTKAYRAMLRFLEDDIKGVGAKEIIGYGHSIGAGVQGEALKDHILRNDIKYVFIKSRTFSNMKNIVMSLTKRKRMSGCLTNCLGWNIDPAGSSKKLKAPEIILQTADVEDYEELHDSSKIIYDSVIPAKAALATALLDDQSCNRSNKLFIGIPDEHNDPLTNPSFLAHKIEKMLSNV